VSLPFVEPPSLAVDRLGRILLLEHPPHSDAPSREVIRLLSNGSSDGGFGTAGRAIIRLSPHASLSAVGTDTRGRPLLAGAWRKGQGGAFRFLLKRLTASGRIDRAFGQDGTIITGFGRVATSEAEQILVGGGKRIVLGGTAIRPSFPAGGSGIGLARYFSGL
jgi:hypothetical protein